MADKPDHWIDGIQEAALEVVYWFARYDRETTPTGAARALTELSGAIGDLSTYLPGYDVDLGGIDWEKLEADELADDADG